MIPTWCPQGYSHPTSSPCVLADWDNCRKSFLYTMSQITEEKWKWNESRCFRLLFALWWMNWAGMAWANEVKFLWNVPQISTEPATYYSESSVLRLDHGGPLKEENWLSDRETNAALLTFPCDMMASMLNRKWPYLIPYCAQIAVNKTGIVNRAYCTCFLRYHMHFAC